jgi:hypothetical protein
LVQKADALTVACARGAGPAIRHTDLLHQNISRFAKFGGDRNSF